MKFCFFSATFGMSAAATMGRILFEDFDLNRHKIVGTSDLVLKLNEENLGKFTKLQ